MKKILYLICLVVLGAVVVVRLGVTHDDSWSSEAFIRGVLDRITG